MGAVQCERGGRIAIIKLGFLEHRKGRGCQRSIGRDAKLFRLAHTIAEEPATDIDEGIAGV